MTDNCAHQWKGIGVTTICEPEIAHHECVLCGVVRSERLNDRYRNDPRGPILRPNDVWLSEGLPGAPGYREIREAK